MADKATDLPLHEMEDLKRQMRDLDVYSDVPAEVTLQVPMEPLSPAPPEEPEADNESLSPVYCPSVDSRTSLRARRGLRAVLRHGRLVILLAILLSSVVFLVDQFFRKKVFLARVACQGIDIGKPLPGDPVVSLLHTPEVLAHLRDLLRKEWHDGLREAAVPSSAIPFPPLSDLTSLVGEDGSPLPVDFARQCGAMGYVSGGEDGGGEIFVRGPNPELHRRVADLLVTAVDVRLREQRMEIVRNEVQGQRDSLVEKHQRNRDLLNQLRLMEEAFFRGHQEVEVYCDTDGKSCFLKSLAKAQGEEVESEVTELLRQSEEVKSASRWLILQKRYNLAGESDIRPLLASMKDRSGLEQEEFKSHEAVDSSLLPASSFHSVIQDRVRLEVIEEIYQRLAEWQVRSDSLRQRKRNSKEGIPAGSRATLAEKDQEKRHEEVQKSIAQWKEQKRQYRVLLADILAQCSALDECQYQANRVAEENLFFSAGPVVVSLESPQVFRDTLLAFCLGILIGGGVSFFLECIENRLRTPFDIHYHFRLKTLGVIPYGKEAGDHLISPAHPEGPLAEVFALLRTTIRYSLPVSPEKVLMVTSASRGEGKSTISANLAISYALEGNTVILIDGDLSCPHPHQLMKEAITAQTRGYGLSDYLARGISFEETLYPATFPGLFLLPAGKKSRPPAARLGSDRMRKLIEHAKERFDIVIIDAPPLLPVAEAAMMARASLGVILVVSAEETRVDSLRIALHRLEHTGCSVSGVVLNKVKERFAGDCGGHNHRG